MNELFVVRKCLENQIRNGIILQWSELSEVGYIIWLNFSDNIVFSQLFCDMNQFTTKRLYLKCLKDYCLLCKQDDLAMFFFLHFRFLKIGQITLSRGPKGGSHESKMRGGGPKLFCSPYFSIGASLVLVIMTIKYYSLSSSYDDLLLKVSVFQNQLKLT